MPSADPDSTAVLPQRPSLEPIEPAGLRLRAPAKINLNLLVGPRGPYGRHELDSFVVKITLYDRIGLRPRDDGQLTFECRGADCGPDQQNLALRAARRLADGRNVPGADILLIKQIPPGKGLGGGSSDAAAVLVGLNQLWRLGAGAAELADLAAQLGADVPLFLCGPACRITGAGECVRPVTVHPFFAVVLLPACSCSTAEVYREYDRHPAAPSAQISEDLLASQPPSAWRGLLENQLSAAAKAVCPELAEARDAFAQATRLPVCMTGSGSGLFVLCDTADGAAGLVGRLTEGLKRRCLIVQPNHF